MKCPKNNFFKYELNWEIYDTNLISSQNLAPPVDDQTDPCNPSPCGSNAICKKQNGAGSCVCKDEFFGDPYIGCRPECTTNAECPTDMACSNQKCKNPCLGVCGFNSECRVLSHKPLCTCIEDYEGEPTRGCTRREICKTYFISNSLKYYLTYKSYFI